MFVCTCVCVYVGVCLVCLGGTCMSMYGVYICSLVCIMCMCENVCSVFWIGQLISICCVCLVCICVIWCVNCVCLVSIWCTDVYVYLMCCGMCVCMCMGVCLYVFNVCLEYVLCMCAWYVCVWCICGICVWLVYVWYMCAYTLVLFIWKILIQWESKHLPSWHYGGASGFKVPAEEVTGSHSSDCSSGTNQLLCLESCENIALWSEWRAGEESIPNLEEVSLIASTPSSNVC